MELPANHSARNETDLEEDEAISSHSVFETATFICTMFMLIFCLIGIFGNVLSAVIFTRPAMRSSINVLFAGLSLIDSFMLLIGIVVFVVPNFQSYFRVPAEISEKYLGAIILGGLYQLGMIAQTCSVWTFVLISVERYLAVCHPFKISRILSARKARLALLCVVIAAIAYNTVRMFEYQKTGDGYSRWLRSDPLYIYVYYVSLYLVTHLFVPYSVIVTLNVLILTAIRKSRQLRLDMNRYKRRDSPFLGNHHARKTVERAVRTQQMVFVVTAIFGICNILPFALNVWEAVMPTVFDDPNFQSMAYLMVDISNTLVTFNSASTFILYAAYCRKYRAFMAWYSFCLFRFLKGKDKLIVNAKKTDLRSLLKNQKTVSSEMF